MEYTTNAKLFVKENQLLIQNLKSKGPKRGREILRSDLLQVIKVLQDAVNELDRAGGDPTPDFKTVETAQSILNCASQDIRLTWEAFERYYYAFKGYRFVEKELNNNDD